MEPDQKTSPPPPPPPPQWVLDINTLPPTKLKTTSVPDPPGYAAPAAMSKRGGTSKQSVSTSRKPASPEEMDTLKLKKAWEVAIAPAKSLPMSAFGMWMTGNSLQIFSLFMVYTLFKAPLQALLGMQGQFARFEGEGTRSKMWMVKAVFVLCNLLALGLGVYKVDKMGLLPTTRSDWLAWETQRIPVERAVPDFYT